MLPRTSWRRSSCSARAALSEVEEAQAKVVTEIRTLEQAGKIVIARGSDDAFVE